MLDISPPVEILVIVLNFITVYTLRAMIANNMPASSCQPTETRCECGQLIAKVCGQCLELKCKRCKRIVVIPFTSIEGWGTVTA